MKVYLGTDHAGYELKEELKNYLTNNGYKVEDCGAHNFKQTDDYPDFVASAAKKVASNQNSFGVVLGYSGAGECIVANKIKGIRAFLATNEENVILAREHNDANVISFGSHFTDKETATRLLELFLKTSFSDEDRHTRRINKIKKLENEL